MIAIAAEVRVPRGSLPKRELSAFVREACAAIPLNGEVSVLLTTDAAIRELNRSFRRKNKSTDVLSFPAALTGLAGAPVLAGDLAVSLDTAGRQAAAFGHTLLLEVKVLLLHGLLHLAGYDHERDSGQMGRRERGLRARLGLPLGLIQRTTVIATVTDFRKRFATNAADPGSAPGSAPGAAARSSARKHAPKLAPKVVLR